MSLVDVVAQLEQVPGVQLDRGFRLGREAVRKQLEQRIDNLENDSVDRFISSMQEGILDLKLRSVPYEVPADYLLFMETYAGMQAYGENEDYWFSLYGLGPMTEDWYAGINSDEVIL